MSHPTGPQASSAAKSIAPAPEAFRSAPHIGPAFEQSRDPSIAAQTADQTKTEAQRRQSFMVKQDRPQPVQRPSPTLALGPDGAAFNARWEKEQSSADRQTRKAEFMAKRSSPSPNKSINRNRT